MFDDLAGRRVLVTGASTGIGAAVAKAMGAAGAHVAVQFNSSEARAAEVAEHIGERGGKASTVRADLAQPGAPETMVAEAVAFLGGLDVLINNAGAMIRRAPLDEVSDTLFDAVLDTNARSMVMASKAAAPHLREGGKGGAIINVSSIAARNGGGPGAGLYAGAKAFVLNFTRTLAKELASDGIRVNAVSPGVIMTPFHERFSTLEWLETQRKTIPMARIGTPEDAVGVFLFLASNRASGYVTGQSIELNGGQFMP